MALTATAPPKKIENLQNALCLRECKIVSVNPNRSNIFLKKVYRGGDKNFTSYKKILIPIAFKLKELKENYPMTIIYTRLKYCGYGYSLFEQILGNFQFCSDDLQPTSRVFCQFHAPQTNKMKSEILKEISKENSKIRVIFATTALGMGVNAPFVTQVIHIRPPHNMESYLQEFGRAGRKGQKSIAVLYYNNSDISNNQNKVGEEMKTYCTLNKTCLRKNILSYFGYSCHKQLRCCSVCNTDEEDILKHESKEVLRVISDDNLISLQKEVEKIINDWKNSTDLTDYSLFDTAPEIPNNLEENILSSVIQIESEADLLMDFNVWNSEVAEKLFKCIQNYAPL